MWSIVYKAVEAIEDVEDHADVYMRVGVGINNKSRSELRSESRCVRNIIFREQRESSTTVGVQASERIIRSALPPEHSITPTKPSPRPLTSPLYS